MLAAGLALAFVAAHAVQQPTSQVDPRVGTLAYAEGEVYRLATQRGRVLRVQLGRGERIVRARLGDKDGWIVEAELGSSDVFLKPKKDAHPTNLELVTDCCAYAFDLAVLADDARGVAPLYRVSFEYPKRVQPVASPAPQPRDDAAQLEQRMNAAVAPLNWAYSLQAAPGSQDILPSETWDDGRFTYVRIAANREMPQIFRVGADGAESLANRHVDGDLIVMHEVARRWVLRLGSQVIALWNDAFDLDGVPPRAGTSVEGVARVLKASSGAVADVSTAEAEEGGHD
jgi:type IV secretion system protein VirB9